MWNKAIRVDIVGKLFLSILLSIFLLVNATPLPKPSPEEIEKLTAVEAAKILQKLPPQEAGEIMSLISFSKLEGIISFLDWEVLLEMLPYIERERLYLLSESLINRLPEVLPEYFLKLKDSRLSKESSLTVIDYRTWRISPIPEGEWVALATIKVTPIIWVPGKPPAEEKPPHFMVTEALAKFKISLEELIIQLTKPESPPLPPGGLMVDHFAIISLRSPLRTEDIKAGYVTFKVSKEWIKERGIHPWSIQLKLYNEPSGRWIGLPTWSNSEDEKFIYYAAASPGFSLFAVTSNKEILKADILANNLTVVPKEATPEQKVDISLGVTNLSTKERDYVAVLWINRIIEEVKLITLASRESSLVRFSVIKPKGKYEVRIDRLFQSFIVKEAPPIEILPPIPPPPASPSPIPATIPKLTPAPTPPPLQPITPKPFLPSIWAGIIALIALVSLTYIIMRKRKHQ